MRTLAMNKLNLGCGHQLLDGWANIDLIDNPQILKHDLTRPLPCEDDSVDFVYSEHFLEHLDEVDGYSLLENCYRKLKTEGVLRISIPCLDNILYIYNNWEERDSFHHYIKRFHTAAQFVNFAIFGESSTGERIKFLNNANSTNDGHKFLYTQKDLTEKLQKIGFKKIEKVNMRESAHEELQNLESREFICDLTLEATK